jgi:hypothetical protein
MYNYINYNILYDNKLTKNFIVIYPYENNDFAYMIN